MNTFLTRRAYFRRVENDIYDPFRHKKSFKFKSILEVSSQLHKASTQLRDASNFTLKYSSIFRRSVISTCMTTSTLRRIHSTPRHVKKCNYDPNGYHTMVRYCHRKCCKCYYDLHYYKLYCHTDLESCNKPLNCYWTSTKQSPMQYG